MRKIENNHPYPHELQGYLFACLLNDPIAFQTCRPILHPDYFDDQWARAIRLGLKYFDDTGKPAPIGLVQADIGKEFTKFPVVSETDWLITQIEAFCRFRAMENAIFDGLDLLHDEKPTEIGDRMNEALAISINQRQKFQDMHLRDLLANSTPEWLIPGVIYERQVAMIYGPPDNYKSFVILHLVSLLAHGMIWNGHKLKPRPVKYIAAEGAPMMGKRRKAWFLHHNLPLENDDLPVIGEPVMLLDPADMRLFINTQKRKGWSDGLIVVDTVSKCVPGARESDVEMMSQVIASADLIAKELNCGVILVHHTGWDGAHARGSSASLGNCDAMIRIDRKSHHHATMTVEKQKDARRQVFEFVINEVKLGVLDRNGDEITSLCAVEALDDDKAEDDAMTALADRISIATAMTRDEIKQSEVVKLLMQVLGLSERPARRRVIKAIPAEWTKTRCGNDFVELRRVEIDSRHAQIERRQIAT